MRDITRLPLLTTVAGSYPVDGLPRRRAIQRAVEDQVAAGIDLISDGQVRGDMIASFAAHIPGFRPGPDGTWEVEAALDLPDSPLTIPDFVLAREMAGRSAEVKGIVTGPITLAMSCRVATSAPYFGSEDPALILRLADILAHEVSALVASGAQVVQVDEPLLATALGSHIEPELAHDALRMLAATPALPALHVCGDIREIASELLLLPFKVFDIENAGTENLSAFDSDMIEFADAHLSVGCVATDSSEIETVEAIRDRVHAALQHLDAEYLWISPDCGLRMLPRDVAREKLMRLCSAVQDVRAEL
jgi:5-methyltetrahydropteroyltriglutamate--homocysteine methyltransferase